MPKMSAEEIQTAIAKNAVIAVSLDTSIFDRYGDNLEFPVLLLAAKLPTMGVDFLL